MYVGYYGQAWDVFMHFKYNDATKAWLYLDNLYEGAGEFQCNESVWVIW